MSLLKLAQVAGGVQLKTDVEALQKSYDAAKITTSVVKSGDEKYNADELLQKVVNDISEVKGNSSDDVTIASLNEALTSLSSKTIKDVVRLELAVSNNTVTVPADLETKVPGVDTSKALYVYTVDNDILYNEKGEQLTVSLANGTFNGTPSKVDDVESAKKEDGSYVYKTVTLDKVKVFAEGTWSLKDLPEEAVLDNAELQLLAYKDALNSIIVKLAKDDNLIESVQKLIGEQAVADQLASLKTEVEKGYNDADSTLKTTITNEQKTVTDALDTRIQTLESAKVKTLITDKVAVTQAATSFSLTETPTDELVAAYINSVAYFEGEEFTVDRTAKTVTWTDTDLVVNTELTDKVIFRYFAMK